MIRILRFVDKYLGGLVIFFLLPLKLFNQKKTTEKKILLIKLWALGDSVLCLSLIRAIKSRMHNSRVDVVATKRNRKVFECYKHIDNIYSPFQALQKIRHYDIVFDCEPYLNTSAILSFILGKQRVGFSNQWRSKLYSSTAKFNKKQHMVQNYLDMIRTRGIRYNTKKLEKLVCPNESIQKVNKFFKSNRLTKDTLVIGITPGVAESAKSRMWYEERFAQLADRLIEKRGVKVIFVDAPENALVVDKVCSLMRNPSINAVGKFSLTDTFYLISKCQIFISNDTGPMHVAAAQGCRTVGLFGPNTPLLWGPYGEGNVSIYKTKLPPSIINDQGEFPDKDREGFMGPITVDDVYKEVEKIMETIKKI